jgi:alkanesulfonate monooxygenase SsuD/methylene tetrahydromethanopterin reductase-like flavin-dependent oxidoreductase (luciferase family)
MKLGLFNLMTQLDGSSSTRDIVSDTVSMVQLADDIGFDVAWFAEHHFSNYSICPSLFMMAFYCAGLTKRIRLDPAVLVLPLYHPLRMIDEIGLLDMQSGGRAVIGIGSGYQKFEFDRFQKLTNKRAVSMEIWHILGMALREGAVDDAGKCFSVPPTPVA